MSTHAWDQTYSPEQLLNCLGLPFPSLMLLIAINQVHLLHLMVKSFVIRVLSNMVDDFFFLNGKSNLLELARS